MSFRGSTWTIATLVVTSRATNCEAEGLEILTLEVHPPALARFSRFVAISGLALPVVKRNFLVMASMLALWRQLDFLDERCIPFQLIW